MSLIERIFSRGRRTRAATALLAALCLALANVVSVSLNTAAYAAVPQDAVADMNTRIANGQPPGDAIRDALQAAVCAGGDAGPIAAALITAAQGAGISDAEIGAGLGSGASLVEACNPNGAVVVAQVVANMGTNVLRESFANGVEAAGGSDVLIQTALADPSGAFGGVFGFEGGQNASGNPCDNPSCN